MEVVSEELYDSVKPRTEKYSGFEAFASDGFVSLTGSDNKVPVKILRDTGAKDSFFWLLYCPFPRTQILVTVCLYKEWV